MNIQQTIFIQIGRKRYQVDSLKQASEMFCLARDRSPLGSSKTPDAKIVTEDGKEVARISYNGRVWPPGGYAPNQVPLYDNREVA